MKKLIAETLNEFWTSSDSGLGDFDVTYTMPGESSEEPEDLSEMVPPETIHLSPEEFADYINQLIEFTPQNPNLAINIFREVLQKHPYLKKKPIGFNRPDLYRPHIDKFIESFKSLIHGKK